VTDIVANIISST